MPWTAQTVPESSGDIYMIKLKKSSINYPDLDSLIASDPGR